MRVDDGSLISQEEYESLGAKKQEEYELLPPKMTMKELQRLQRADMTPSERRVAIQAAWSKKKETSKRRDKNRAARKSRKKNRK